MKPWERAKQKQKPWERAAIAAPVADLYAETEIPQIDAQGNPVTPRQKQPQPDVPFIDKAIGVGETGLAALTGATTGSLGFLSGATEGLTDQVLSGDFSPEAGDRTRELAESRAEAGTYMPRGKEGQKYTKKFGEVAGSAAGLAGLSGQMARQGAILQGTKAPRATDMLPDRGRTKLTLTPSQENALLKQEISLENITPQTQSRIPAIVKRAGQSVANTDDEVARLIKISELESKGRQPGLARFRLVDGRSVTDKLAGKAIDSGHAEGIVQLVKTSDPKSRKSMLESLRIHNAIKDNESLLQTKRPTDPAGNSIYKRIKAVRKSIKTEAENLDKFVNRNFRTKDVTTGTEPKTVKPRGVAIDTAPIRTAIDDIFRKLDIEDMQPDGIPKPNFKGSLVSADKGSQRAIKEMIRILSEAKTGDAIGAHKMKRQLDNLINYNKKSTTPMGVDGRNALKAVRGTINDILRKQFPEYGRINDKLSMALDSLEDLNDALPKNVDVYTDNLDRAMGMQVRKLFSNYAIAPDLEKSLNTLDDVANRLSKEKFTDNYQDIYQFTRSLEDVFGKTLKTSLGGEMESAATTAVTQGVKQAGLQAVMGKAGRRLANRAEKKRRRDAFISMRDLLQRLE